MLALTKELQLLGTSSQDRYRDLFLNPTLSPEPWNLDPRDANTCLPIKQIMRQTLKQKYNQINQIYLLTLVK